MVSYIIVHSRANNGDNYQYSGLLDRYRQEQVFMSRISPDIHHLLTLHPIHVSIHRHYISVIALFH